MIQYECSCLCDGFHIIFFFKSLIEWPFLQKRIWRLREGKARVLSEDQDIGVELDLWCKILQESSRRKLGQEVSRDSK